MSSPSLTLQCRQCSGIFAAPNKVDFSGLVQCPHCATAAPVVEFAAIEDGSRQHPRADQSIHPVAKEPSAESMPAPEPKEGDFQVRGKWLQFDCPHCVRPMRLIAEDAGGLVDCAHCGLELIAPDPTLGRGAKLSRASEGRVGSIARYNLRELRGDQLEHSKSKEAPEDDYPEGLFEVADEEDEAEMDPNHALARGAAASPPERKRAVKAIESEQLGRSFRRQEVIAEQVLEASDVDWDPNLAARAKFGESRQDRYGFWIAAGVAAAVMMGVAAMVVREAGQSGKVFDEGELGEIQVAQESQSSRFQSSYWAAERALESPRWEALVPHVRKAQAMLPLMRNYYASNAYEPIELTGFHAPVEVQIGSLSMHEIRVTDTSGDTRTLVIETGDGEPKLDWELFINLAEYDWKHFLETRPSTPQKISVVASRAGVIDRYFKDAGLSRDEAIGFRLWHGRGDGCFAILPKGSEMEKKMSELLEWDKGRKLIIQASFPPESKLSDRIHIDSLNQTGWVTE